MTATACNLPDIDFGSEEELLALLNTPIDEHDTVDVKPTREFEDAFAEIFG